MHHEASTPDGRPPVARHVGIIMDGNGRWAQARKLPRALGHRAGMEAVKRTLAAIKEVKPVIECLTLYGFSSENWGRPAEEVSDLMELLRFYLQNELSSLHKQGIRLRMIGDRSRLAQDIVRQIAEAEAMTRGNTVLNLTIALSYGSRQEILNATRSLAIKVRAGELSPEGIDEAAFAGFLDTHDLPDPDLIIRTSGEQRLSNFLLWQAAYAEFFFTETLWPDFGREDLEAALSEFNKRKRRYGVGVA